MLRVGDRVIVAAYERRYFDLNKLPPHVEYYSLGSVENSKYVTRLPNLIMSVVRLRKLAKKADCIYSFSVDLLMLSFLLPTKVRFYEIGDLRNINHSILRPLFTLVYGCLLRNVNRVFVTSSEFRKYLEGHYKVNPSKVQVIENKLQPSNFPFVQRKKFEPLISQQLRVGIIGLLRYQNIIAFLKAHKVVENHLTIHIFGDGPLRDKILEYVDDSQVFYYGQFRYPDDLAKIYDQIDLNFVMYDSNDLNVRLALPNKLYETMYFAKPILASESTFLAEIAQKRKVGFCWKQDDYTSLVKFLCSTDFKEQYNALVDTFCDVKEHEYLEDETTHSIL